VRLFTEKNISERAAANLATEPVLVSHAQLHLFLSFSWSSASRKLPTGLQPSAAATFAALASNVALHFRGRGCCLAPPQRNRARSTERSAGGPALRCRNCLQGGASRGGTGRRCRLGKNLKFPRWDAASSRGTPNLTTRHRQFQTVGWVPRSSWVFFWSEKQHQNQARRPEPESALTSIKIGAQLLEDRGRARARNRGGWVDSRDSNVI
jgi:hypothetical protein